MVNTRSRAAAVFSPDASPTKAINTMADRIAGLNFAGPSSPFDLASAAEPQTIHTLPLDDEDDEGTDASYIDRQSDAEDEDEPASMAADDEHPSLNRGANMELDCDEIDDLDGSTYTPQHTQEPHKTTDDDASDFFPSDGDEDGPVFTRLTKSSRDKYLHRAQKINGAMMLVFQSTNIQFQGPYLANYRKRNEDEKRWVKKGPVVIYITDGGLHTGYSSVSKIPRILAYYAYGDYSVALNMEVFYDFMNPNFKFVDQNRFIFSTCRLNAVKQVNTTPHRIKLQQVYGGSVPVSASSQVNLKSLGEADVILCQNDVSVVQEETPSVGLFTFMDSEEAQRFYQSLQQGMTLAAQRRLEVRENSFVSPQAVLSDHSQASTSVACPRLVNHEAKAHAMAVNGLRFIPFEGSPLNIQCIYCRFRTPLSQDESWDPIREHRQSQNASAYGCPFAPLS